MKNVPQFIDGLHYTMKIQSKGLLNFRSAKNGFSLTIKDRASRLILLPDILIRSVAIEIIGGYQRHISPRKGYSCAHRIVHGGDSCSQYVKKTLAEKNLFDATLLARQRFRACSIAYLSSKDQVVGTFAPTVGPTDFCTPEMVGACCAIFGIFKICGDKK